MSIDFDCYLARKPFFVPKNIKGNGWQIAINSPAFRFESEDIDTEIFDQINKRSWLLQIHLEGQTNDDAFQKFEELFEKLIKKHDACIYDHQQDLIFTRNGKQSIIRTVAKVREEKTASLTFYFDQKTVFTKSQRKTFYELIETLIPKALPRRYGNYEPMQFKLAENGKEHFLQEWHADYLGLIWRGHAPFQWIFSSVNHAENKKSTQMIRHERYVCSKIEIQFSSKLLKTKKPLAQLLLFQIEASKLLKVFYSEIRYGEPLSSTNWRGLPKEPALTAIIGEPYASLWTDFTENSDKLNAQLYMRRYLASEHQTPRLPEELTAPDLPKENPLNSAPPIAQVFPFEIPTKSKGIPDRYKA